MTTGRQRNVVAIDSARARRRADERPSPQGCRHCESPTTGGGDLCGRCLGYEHTLRLARFMLDQERERRAA